MKVQELIYVSSVVENEGFEYAFRHYTDFVDEVKDPEFHRLRHAYLEARRALAEYIGHEG